MFFILIIILGNNNRQRKVSVKKLFYVRILTSFIRCRVNGVNFLTSTYHFNQIFSPSYQFMSIFFSPHNNSSFNGHQNVLGFRGYELKMLASINLHRSKYLSLDQASSVVTT